MGRSSNSSHYQLSANRLISRVHVKARYIPATEPLEVNKIEIICNGWNGLKLHCQGQTWDLGKGDSFVSETEGAEIMIDVQEARVFLQWPKRDKDRDALSDSSWDESPRPGNGRGVGVDLLSSPLRHNIRLRSPVSPTPANGSTSSASLQDLMPRGDALGETVEIYEDGSADEQELPRLTDANASFMTQATESFSSDLSDPLSDGEKDPDEENDPIVHSFGPFGANLSNRLASFTTRSPKRQLGATLEPLQETNISSANVSPKVDTQPRPVESSLNVEEKEAVSNHVVNQLAFSRLSSTPLSTIMNNVPADVKKDLTEDQLRVIIESTAAVGIIPRQGKDAAGKALESEYYYISEMDMDEYRRHAVTDGLRKPSLRNCRKQHKVSIPIRSKSSVPMDN